jgi:hypothetical protein
MLPSEVSTEILERENGSKQPGPDVGDGLEEIRANAVLEKRQGRRLPLHPTPGGAVPARSAGVMSFYGDGAPITHGQADRPRSGPRSRRGELGASHGA